MEMLQHSLTEISKLSQQRAELQTKKAEIMLKEQTARPTGEMRHPKLACSRCSLARAYSTASLPDVLVAVHIVLQRRTLRVLSTFQVNTRRIAPHGYGKLDQ